MIVHPTRYSGVPWLWDSDLEIGGGPVWQIDNRAFNERASAWKIDGRDEFLILHAVRGGGNDGGFISLAIQPTARYDLFAQESFALERVQSNPRRRRDEESDGA